jgi:acyl homoserine lactone synthase
MLERFWPWLVASGQLPHAPDVWEMTRVCVDKTVAPELRKTILPELLAAAKEFFVDQGSMGMIGVTRAHLLSHFIRQGIMWLGEPATIEGETERAFFVPTRFVRPDHHCARYGIADPVLMATALEERRNAA